MTDSRDRCVKYQKAREATKGSAAGAGWHKIEPAPSGSVPWKQKTASRGNKHDGGWIGKGGYSPHT